MARNGKVGGSNTSLKTWVQERSTMVTAKLEREGLMWEPIPAPRICCQITFTAWKIWQDKDPCTIGKMSSGWITFVFLGAPCSFPTYESCKGFPRWDMSTESTVSGWRWFHSKIKGITASRSDSCGTELKNPTKSSLHVSWHQAEFRQEIGEHVAKSVVLPIVPLFGAIAEGA